MQKIVCIKSNLCFFKCEICIFKVLSVKLFIYLWLLRLKSTNWNNDD